MPVGRWETVRELGQGGQGVAHLAIDATKLDSSTTRMHGGLGLGLALVRHLVEAQEALSRLTVTEKVRERRLS